MGTRYLFTCHCGFRASVAGDFDIGDDGPMTTIVCETCHRLYDVPAKLVDNATHPPQHDLAAIRCPRAKTHPWKIWTWPGPCPRCGAIMRLGDMLQLWD